MLPLSSNMEEVMERSVVFPSLPSVLLAPDGIEKGVATWQRIRSIDNLRGTFEIPLMFSLSLNTSFFPVNWLLSRLVATMGGVSSCLVFFGGETTRTCSASS